MNLTLNQLTDIIAGRLRFGRGVAAQAGDEVVGRVAGDSRVVAPGDLFWPLERDPHIAARYTDEAFENGAWGVVTDNAAVSPPDHGFVIHVDDAKWALWQVARDARLPFRGMMIQVSGIVGKSVTARMIDGALSARLHGTASSSDLPKPAAVALALLDVDASAEYAVVETPFNSAAEVAANSHLCCPDIIAITSLERSLPSGFDSEAELVDSIRTLITRLPSNGLAILNGDDPICRRLGRLRKAGVVWVGRGSDCNVAARDVQTHDGRVSFNLDGQDFELPIWGRHFVTSALAAIVVARRCGLQDAEIAAALRGFRPLPQRCEVCYVGDICVVNDTSGARPVDTLAALDVLWECTARRRVVVVGELSVTRSAEAAFIGEAIAYRVAADRLITFGNMAESVARGARGAGLPAGRVEVCEDLETARKRIADVVEPGDAVLVKGNRASHPIVDQIIAGQRELQTNGRDRRP